MEYLQEKIIVREGESGISKHKVSTKCTGLIIQVKKSLGGICNEKKLYSMSGKHCTRKIFAGNKNYVINTNDSYIMYGKYL